MRGALEKLGAFGDTLFQVYAVGVGINAMLLGSTAVGLYSYAWYKQGVAPSHKLITLSAGATLLGSVGWPVFVAPLAKWYSALAKNCWNGKVQDIASNTNWTKVADSFQITYKYDSEKPELTIERKD